MTYLKRIAARTPLLPERISSLIDPICRDGGLSKRSNSNLHPTHYLARDDAVTVEHLSSAIDLHAHVKQAHWNAAGKPAVNNAVVRRRSKMAAGIAGRRHNFRACRS
jgi:hypothetical protein